MGVIECLFYTKLSNNDLLYRLSQKKKKKKKKITIGLSASISLKIVNQSKYALGLCNYNLCAFRWKPHPIWFISYKEIGIFVRHVISPFHPSFDRR